MKDDILAGIDDVLLEASSSTIKHKVWNSLFAGWEDLDEHNHGSLNLIANQRVGGRQFSGGCECELIYTRPGSSVALFPECTPHNQNVAISLHPLMKSTTLNMIAVLWYELNVSPCEARLVGYDRQATRVLENTYYRRNIWNIPGLPAAFTPEEQDKIIEILLSFDNPTPIGE